MAGSGPRLNHVRRGQRAQGVPHGGVFGDAILYDRYRVWILAKRKRDDTRDRLRRFPVRRGGRTRLAVLRDSRRFLRGARPTPQLGSRSLGFRTGHIRP